MREYMINRYRRRRKELIKQLGGKCRDCGTKKRLEFHHTEKKDFWVGKRLHTISEAELQKEIKKCVLLCCSCHHTISAKARGFHNRKQHGTVVCYQYGKCRCDKCRAAKTEQMREYRRTRRQVAKPQDF